MFLIKCSSRSKMQMVLGFIAKIYHMNYVSGKPILVTTLFLLLLLVLHLIAPFKKHLTWLQNLSSSGGYFKFNWRERNTSEGVHCLSLEFSFCIWEFSSPKNFAHYRWGTFSASFGSYFKPIPVFVICWFILYSGSIAVICSAHGDMFCF